MSTLREALEKLAAELEYDAAGAPGKIRALLAAHPAEPARSMPTLEQIAEALHDEDNAHSWRHSGVCTDWCFNLYLKRAGAVLALLTEPPR